MLDPAVHAQLAAILPPSALLTAAEDTRPYECDGLTLYRELPAAVALPENEAQVVAILRALPRGARAGRRARRGHEPFGRRAAGQATASCCRWRSSSRSSRSIRSRARRSCSRACATSRSPRRPRRYGLYYAPDPSSQIACTIGGNVAENAGGVHCLKYGLTVHNVRRVRGVLITGEIVEFGGDALDSAGLRPARADQRLRRPARGHHRDHGQAHAEAAAGAGRARRVRRRRRRRAPRSAAVIAAGHRSRGPRDDGPGGDARGRGVRPRELSARRRRRCCWSRPTARRRKSPPRWRRSGACWPRPARPKSACRRTRRSGCCSGRAARRRFRRSAASRPTTTAWTARSRASALAAGAARGSRSCREQYGLRCANVFHAGDGNLHPLILFDANVDGEIAAHRGVRRRDPRAVHRGRRHDHRRARRRRREAAADVRAVQRRPSSSASSAIKAAFDPHGAAQSRQGRADAASLRRVRQDARPSRPAAASRTSRASEARADTHERA